MNAHLDKVNSVSATWSERQVLERCGISEKETTEEMVSLAAYALHRFYYIDQASRWLLAQLKPIMFPKTPKPDWSE